MLDKAKKRHIAIFIPSLRGGGAERVMVALANECARQGYQVDLILAQAEGPFLAEVALNVRLVNLGKRRVFSCLFPLTRYLRKERPDAMLSALNHANIIAILARKLANADTRLVVSERNSLMMPAGKKEKIIRLLMRKLYPMSDHVVAVSQAMAKELVTKLGISSNLVSSIPNPVDVEAIQCLAKELPGHPWLEPGQPSVILAVGRLEPQKDYPTLIAAFAQLRISINARLIILGEGSQRASLERLIAELCLTDSVELAGFKENPFGWMAASSVFVLSSRYEGFPNVLVQAMACGAKIVCTDCPTGPREITEGGRWGRLVPVGNQDALAKAMIDALGDQSPPEVVQRAEVYRREESVALYIARLE